MTNLSGDENFITDMIQSSIDRNSPDEIEITCCRCNNTVTYELNEYRHVPAMLSSIRANLVQHHYHNQDEIRVNFDYEYEDTTVDTSKANIRV